MTTNPITPFRRCDVPECMLRRHHEGVHADNDGDHTNAFGDTWASAERTCPSPRCVLTPGHTGVHADHPEPFVVNACAAQLHRLLTTPGLPGDAPANLASAQTVWETLDSLLHTGAPLPDRWATPRTGGPLEGVATTPAYDELCDTLDATPPGGGYTVNELPTLREACRWWRSLDTVLRAGGMLPAPWRAVVSHDMDAVPLDYADNFADPE